MNKTDAETIKARIVKLTENGLMDGWRELKYVDLRVFHLLEQWDSGFPEFKKKILNDKSLTEMELIPWDQVYIYFEDLKNEH